MQGAYNIPMDDQAEALAIQRRMKLADALRQKSMTPTNATMVGKTLVANPWGSVSGLSAALLSNRAEQDAMNEASRYSQDKRARLAQTLAGIKFDDPNALAQAGISLSGDNPQLAGTLLGEGFRTRQMRDQFEHADKSQSAMFENQAQRDERLATERAAERESERTWRTQQAEQAAALQRELAGMREASANKPYSTPIYTPEGVFAFDNRAGTAKPVAGPDGRTLVRSTDDPTLQAQVTGAREGAKVDAKAQAQARIDLPQVQATTEQMIKHVDELKNHPGMSDVVGAPSVLSLGGRVPGTKGADFRARLEQVQGGSFLQAFNTLKGGGQITEVEGKKATDAIARMQTSQSEDAFRQAADEFQQVMTGVLERARQRAGAVPGGINEGAKPRTVFDDADAIINGQ